ncbi:hypothetical protein MPTK1_5g04220 [Marchantia polymorpha subsp. ruderalis]|nr:hypothetical protein MARPO_0141s0029 [Marchantia polymorpha]BBN10525.1 hypothetical protein Mp_5g04220 [Marchantia polymorpha subsp. ruderalis]|eukprot:PTQ29454.1 hypothetical protein MARPO_0141s0029 [Marchantia polymorpha]
MRDGSGCSVIYVWLILLLSTFFRASTSVAQSPQPDNACPYDDDRCALLQFQDALENKGPGSPLNWKTSNPPANWSGVVWHLPDDGRMYVEKLQLHGFELQGDIQPLFQQKLLRMSELDVSFNNFSGSLPSPWRICPSLKSLNLSGNSIQGSLPKEVQCEASANVSTQLVLESLRNLQNLSLANNKFSDGIPSSLLEVLSSLQVLDLSGNNFTGALPREISALVNLTTLLLNGNGFDGSIPPSLSKCSELKELNLQNNSLTGQIPRELGQLSNLSTLILGKNKLTGSIPPSLSKCSELKELNLGENEFSGRLPLDVFTSLSNLEILDVSSNLIVGELLVSTDLGQFRSLRNLILSGNNLSGSVPENLGNLTNLEILELKSNNFTGHVPTSLGGLSRLRTLNLQNNSLTGQIPRELGQLSNLSTLILGKNKLTGEIPTTLGNCAKLRSLWLNQNTFNGSIPVELYHLRNLVVLSLFDNKLNATISPEVRKLSNLVVLDFSFNLLRGSIPKEICELSRVRILLLNNNGLTDSLPDCIGNFSSLQILDLSFNFLSGDLPGDYSGLYALKNVNRTLKQLVPEEMRMTTYDQQIMNQILTWKAEESPTLILLSSNQFTGEIPPGFGELRNMQELDLSNNFFSGPIPPALGNATALFLLKLANNSLSGPIPEELTNLTFLSIFNVSNNDLSGPIPQGYQFSTFSNDSFSGNPHLCGYPMPECTASYLPSSSPAYAESGGDLDKKFLPLYIVGAGAMTAFIFIASLVAWSCIGRCRRRNSCLVSHSCDLFDNDELQFLQVTISSFLPMRITHKELAIATENYNDNNIIGDGGFGLVYKAVLNNGVMVAVKKLVEDGMQGQSEFLAEMRTLGKIKHKNLVCLLGYCSYGRERILVYEYLKHGSLDSWLHCRDEGVPGLDWRTRLKIARGAAEGLAFLHHDCIPAIIHRDIKVSNILLDGEFESRLADFGLARSTKGFESHVSTELAGTAGYIPPEYSQATAATLKGDVYSFGVVLLEIITGKRPTDPFYKKKDMAHVAIYIQDMAWRDEALDKAMAYSCNDQMVEFMRIAGLCCHPCPSKRPHMNQVVRMLELLERQCPSRNPSVVLYDEEGISSPRCR